MTRGKKGVFKLAPIYLLDIICVEKMKNFISFLAKFHLNLCDALYS